MSAIKGRYGKPRLISVLWRRCNIRIGALIRIGARLKMAALIRMGALINKNTFEGERLFWRGGYWKEGANWIITVGVISLDIRLSEHMVRLDRTKKIKRQANFHSHLLRHTLRVSSFLSGQSFFVNCFSI